MLEVTDWLDVDPIRFTWVEEVGEMMLAWLTLIGAAIGVRERAHFTLHVSDRFSPATQRRDRPHPLRAGRGHRRPRASYYGVKLCLLEPHAGDAGPRDQPGAALRAPPSSAGRCSSSTPYRWSSRRRRAIQTPFIEGCTACCCITVAAIFVVLILFSMPIVFALGVAGVAGLCARRLPTCRCCPRAWSRARRAGCCSPSRPSSSPAA